MKLEPLTLSPRDLKDVFIIAHAVDTLSALAVIAEDAADKPACSVTIDLDEWESSA